MKVDNISHEYILIKEVYVSNFNTVERIWLMKFQLILGG